jgi:L-rhamnose mutarotase
MKIMTDEAIQLKLAQDLVKDGEYEQARAILSTLTHNPTAQKWLEQLNARYPHTESVADDEALRKAQQLIDQENYVEATALLQTIAHNETAQKWLSRIENLEKSSSVAQNLRAEIPEFSANAFPVPPQLQTVIQDNILKHLGDVNGTIAIGAIVFGVLSAILHAISPTEGFVIALLNTLLFGGFAYGLSVALSLTHPNIAQKTLFAFVGFTLMSVFVGFLILSGTSSNLIRWLVYAIIGSGLAYVLSHFNTITHTVTSTAISKSLMPLTAIALTLLSYSHLGIIRSTFIIKGSGMGLGGLVGGLIGGLIVGALLSAIIVISLRESQA